MQKIFLTDYKDALIPYRREKGKYYCPACQGHNLSFARDGRWNCWNDPTRSHRLEIMAAIVPDFDKNMRDKTREIKLNFKPKVHPARLRYPQVQQISLSHIISNRTTHIYSNCQRVVRHDYRKRKVIYPQYFDLALGCWLNGAGTQPWLPFGLSRLLPYPGAVNLVLLVEGQKCVEIAHSRGIAALCLEGGDYSNATIAAKLAQIEQRLKPLLLVVLPDNDEPGRIKTRSILMVANSLGIPAIELEPLTIVPNLQLKGDIEQMPNLNERTLLQIIRDNLKGFKSW